MAFLGPKRVLHTVPSSEDHSEAFSWVMKEKDGTHPQHSLLGPDPPPSGALPFPLHLQVSALFRSLASPFYG